MFLFKAPKLVPIFLLQLIVSSVFFSLPAFAEGDNLCASRFIGTTENYNANAGLNYFDAHGTADAGDDATGGGAADLSIVYGFDAGGSPETGPAPMGTNYAACLEGGEVTVLGAYTSNPTQFNYAASHLLTADYEARGWFWNDNWGFISMACISGENQSGPDGADTSYNCDPNNTGIEYGVYLSPEYREGTSTLRDLYGYAWGENLGWIQFKGVGNDGSSDFAYGVYMDEDGDLHGHAWTEAGIYLNFEGASIDLIDDGVELVQVGGDGYCADNSNIYPICVEVDPYPRDLDFGDYPVADCNEGYTVTVYARDEDGNALELDTEDYDLASMELVWVDKLRAEQVVQPAADYDFDTDRDPWSGPEDGGVHGAVVYKPLEWGDFEPLYESTGKVPGVFVSTSDIASCAPTSNANISYTTSTNPPHEFSNENFIAPGDIDAEVVSKLALTNVKYGEITDEDGNTAFSSGTTQANGIGGLAFKFKPAISVGTLYEGDAQDAFIGDFSYPNTFAFELTAEGDEDYLSDAGAGSVTLQMYQPDCETDPTAEINYYFKTDFDGSTAGADYLRDTISSLYSYGQVFITAQPETPDACSDLQVANTAMYTEVQYDIDGERVSYYHNKLPRIDNYEEAFSFYSYIVGKVNAEAFGLMGDNNQNVAIDTSNVVNMATLDAAISKNLSDLGFSVFSAGGDTCTIQVLDTADAGQPYRVAGCSEEVDYEYTVIGDEQVLYFVDADVNIELSGDGAFDGLWNIVVDGGNNAGNIFINSDIYNDNPAGKHLNVIARRPWTGDLDKGNIYVKPCVDAGGVKNIQAALIADGSVFSYADVDDIDEDTGEPIWGSADAIDYSEMLGALSTCQLFVEGVISAQNSIGGAKYEDEDQLLIGGGRFIDNEGPESLMRAQLYDIHYLRAFTATLEFDADGHPIDQNCGTGLSNEDIANIAAGQTVCGDLGACDPAGSADQDYACNGINSEAYYVEGPQAEGDLIPPLDENGDIDDSVLSRGIYDNDEIPDEEKYFPSYIFYRPLPKDSFLFKSDAARSLFGF